MIASRLLPVLLVILVIGAASSSPNALQQKPDAPPQKTGVKVNHDAAVLQDFNARVHMYLQERKQAVKDVPPLKVTKDQSQIKATQNMLAANIAAARSTEQPGHIFTPEVRTKFRQLLYPEMQGEDGRDARKVIKDDAPAGKVTFKVNAKYPEGVALPTVPVKLLVSLPRLPEQLEYRIIGKHLILRDTEADIIVDYMLNVIQ